MRSRVVEAIAKIEANNGIEVLQKSPCLEERYKKLMELSPEIMTWSPMIARMLVFHLQSEYKVDLGVCEYYSIDDYRQYCSHGGEKYECLCVIPQPFCVFRDQGGKPKDQELTPTLS